MAASNRIVAGRALSTVGDHAIETDVVVVGALVVAPAQVHPHAGGVEVAGRVVEHVDVERRAGEELAIGERLEPGVACHREVGAVELDIETGVDDRLVFDSHGLADGDDVLLVEG